MVTSGLLGKGNLMNVSLKNPAKRSRTRRWWLTICLVGVIVAVSGCHTLSFYGQAAKGQYQLLAHRQAIDRLVADPGTPPRLKSQLELIQKLRGFAEREL